MKNNIRMTAVGGLIAALYVVLTIGQNILLPGSTSQAVQFRISEVLCVLAVFTPVAIPGLTIGCLAANIIAGLGAADLVFGPLATLAAVVLMYLFRNIKLHGVPLLSLLMPAIANGIIVGLEIAVFFSDGFTAPVFLTSGGCVAIGEAAVLIVLGVPFYFAVKKTPALKKLL